MEDPLDFEQLEQEWIRRARGRRSQRALSRRLGYQSNVVYRWETGRAHPSAASAFAMMAKTGFDVSACLARFLATQSSWLAHTDPTSREGVARLLEELRGQTPLVVLAAESGLSRFQIARWLQSTNEPRLHELLRMVHVCSRRLLDFIAAFFGDTVLPSVARQWRRLVATRQAAYDKPQSHLVLRTLELEAYTRLPKHRKGFIAQTIGLSEEEELECLELLEAAGQIAFKNNKWVTIDEPVVDTRADRERSRQLRGFWLRRAAADVERGQEGTFGYNLFSISEADLERARQIHVRYYREMQELIRNSSPNERVVLFATQFYTLDKGTQDKRTD